MTSSMQQCGAGESNELAHLYKNSFKKLDDAEQCGNDCQRSRCKLINNFKIDLIEQIEMLTEMLESTIQEKTDLRSKLQEQTHLVNQLSDDLCHTQQEVTCLNKEKSSLDCKVRDLNNEIEKMSIDATRELEEQDEEIKKLRRTSDTLTCEIDRQSKEIGELMSSLTQTEQQLRLTDQELCDSKELHAQLEVKFDCYIRGHRHSNEEVASKEENLAVLSSALRDSEHENRTIKQKLSDISRC